MIGEYLWNGCVKSDEISRDGRAQWVLLAAESARQNDGEMGKKMQVLYK
jgi:hypothetical protein